MFAVSVIFDIILTIAGGKYKVSSGSFSHSLLANYS